MVLAQALRAVEQEFRLQACLDLRTALVPAGDVRIEHGQCIATSGSPWLELRFAHRVPAGSWIRLTYRASLLDTLVRPLIRFETRDGHSLQIMTAPVFGKADWFGRIPNGCRNILISPVDTAGPFSFELTGCRALFRASLMLRPLLRNRRKAFMAMGARCIQAREETRQTLMFARGGMPFSDYADWRRKRERAYDPKGVDRSRVATGASPHFHFIVEGPETIQDLDACALVRSLKQQNHASWSCSSIGTKPQADEMDLLGEHGFISPASSLHDVINKLPDGTYLARIAAASVLEDYALPALSEHLARCGLPPVAYGDEEIGQHGSAECRPCFKPDWSPVLESRSPYLGQAVFWSAKALLIGETVAITEFDTWPFRRSRLRQMPAGAVSHLRRVLMASPMPQDRTSPPPFIAENDGASRHAHGAFERSLPRNAEAVANIVIPNKDRFDLVSEVVKGVLATEDHRNFNLVIVDNGSTDPEVLALYEDLVRRENVRIVRCPGKFNYSRMCNLGAAAFPADVHVFLNNDISMQHRHWLAPLVDWALRPDIGAVGARLLFPGGGLQHAGVVTGMGGIASHIYDNADAGLSGEFNCLRVAHEVSAVTGACIAIEGRKFDRIGRFDEANLPVELNDIDLCLRLDAAGYVTLMCPQSELIHHQSASRGLSYRPFTRYRQERRYFLQQWGETLRHDRFFHPALSLYSTMPALDG
jgi:O-antigen biosynthesis protein